MNHSSSDRLAASLRSWIASAPAGARLPSTRELVATHRVSAATVRAALARLSAEGLVITRPGDGTFAARSRPAGAADFSWQTAALGPAPFEVPGLAAAFAPAAPGELNLAEAYPEPGLLPLEAVRAALQRVARTPALGERAPVAGVEGLRAWVASDLASRTPAGVASAAAKDVLVLPGSQSGLGAIFRAVVGRGQPMLIESPTYWGARLAAAQAGVVLVPVPSGPHGPDPEEVERAFERSGARAFYAQPTFANPHGATWDATARRDILALARRRGAFIIEDEWAADFSMDAVPAPLAAADPDGAVIGLRSLTKSVSPALRVAAVTARGPVHARILAEVQAQSLYVSPVLQHAALDVVTSPRWAAHRRALPARLRERRDLLATALATHAPQLRLGLLPRGGLNLWLGLPEQFSEAAVTLACARAGVQVFPGARAFPAEAPAGFLRLSFASTPAERLEEAARLVGHGLSEAERHDVARLG
jgi:DNA-binding transcriptional MocR family regulator